MVKTRMLLQNQGCRNHPAFKIVVMKDKGALKGRYLEHVGYWLPKETKAIDRAVILNKNRIRYWLAMGTVPSKRVQLFLSFSNILPAPVTKWGKGNQYEKPEKQLYEQKSKKSFDIGSLELKYNQYRQQQQENVLIQKLNMANEMNRQINYKEISIQYNKYDIDDRTKEFYRLKNQLMDIEKDLSNNEKQKRQNLIQQMNELAGLGIKSEPYKEKLDKIYEFDENQFKQAQENEKICKDKKLQFIQLMQNIEQKKQIATQDLELLKPVDMQQYKNIVQKEGINPNDQDVQEDISDEFVTAKMFDKLPTKFDALTYAKQDTKNIHLYKLVCESMASQKNVIFPSKIPVNPFPDITKWDPEDYYDVKKISEVSQLDYNEGYDLPNIDSRKVKKDMRVKTWIYSKDTLGRKKKLRSSFSTINSLRFIQNYPTLIRLN